MVKTIVLIVVLALAGLLIFAATRPATFRVQRTTSIRAPADRIFHLINDLQQFNTWNPFEKKDPNMRGSYRGPAAGPGAAYDFQGNKDVGRGSLEIIEVSNPAKVTMRLDMLEPIEGHNIVEFTIVPNGEATDVTWAINGACPYMARLMGVFFNMDAMIGRDFEAGLASLKAVAERT